MTKKPTVLPSSGGSYVRNSKGIKQVQEPTKELTGTDRKADEQPVDTTEQETDT